jgi:hypothetical protein
MRIVTTLFIAVVLFGATAAAQSNRPNVPASSSYCAEKVLSRQAVRELMRRRNCRRESFKLTITSIPISH